MDLTGKVAVVTGAAVGIGRAIARRMAAEGASVVVADVDVPHGRETALLIDPTGKRTAFAEVDVRSAGDLRRLVRFSVAAFGGIDVLVNNAGGGGHIPPHYPQAGPTEWGATLDLNLRGPMMATQLMLEPMRRRGGGAVVNVSSTAGLGVEEYQSPEYAAAKAGLIRFTSTLGPLRDSAGVRVNCVVPDWIATERAIEELAAMTPAERAAAPSPIPMDDVCDVIVGFLRSDSTAGEVVALRPGQPPCRL